MYTLQPVLKRGCNSLDEINLPGTDLIDRVTQIRKLMVKSHLDVLLLYSNNINNYGHTFYVSNYKMDTDGETIVVIPVEGKVALVFEGGARILQTVKSLTWIEELVTGGRLINECSRYLKQNNLIPATIGLVGFNQLMPYQEWQIFKEAAVQCDLVDAKHILEKLRAQKSTREIDQVRRSGRILQQVLGALVNTASSELTERVIQAEAERCAYLAEASDFRMLLARPEDNKITFRPPGDSMVAGREIITIFLAVEFQGYWSTTTRSFAAEPPKLKLIDSKIADVIFSQLMEHLKVGSSISQFYKQASTLLEENGAGPLPIIGLGNGIGLGIQEFPLITGQEKSRFKNGMCLTINSPFKYNQTIDCLTGHTVVLGESGPEVII